MVDIVTRAGKGSPLTNNEVDANFTNLAEVAGVTGEPMGHEDRTTSTISFNASTRTFTIAPVSSSFTVWCEGKKVVVSSAQTVTIPNTTGMYSIYFDANGALAAKAGYFTFSSEAPTAYIYWNAEAGTCPYFGDERHGVVLDWQTHEYLHRTRGAALASGFAASGYTLGGNGSLNSHAQLTLEGGTFFDEDMKIIVTATNTPTAGTWEQDLLSPARIPVLYLSGTSWVIDAPTDYPLKQGTSRPRYNAYSAGVWSTADVANNKYATSWILATNNLTYPVIAIIGQAESDSQSSAEAVDFTSLQLPGFPSVEFRPLYKLVFQCADSFSIAVKASLVSITDIRSIASASTAASLVTDHGNLTGLSDDDHPQYLNVDTVRTSLTAAVKASFLPSQTGNAGGFLTTNGTATSWTALTSSNITTALGFTPYNATNPSGYISGISSSDVTTALGFTPYNATNPSGYVTAAGARGAISVTGAGSYDSATGVINIVGGVTSFNTRTGAITLSSADVTNALGFTPYNSTNPNGYLTGITSMQVTTALGYTPYNSSNPSGYITGITSGMVTTALGYTPYNSSNPSGYITSSALSSYLPLSGGTLTGLLTSAIGANGYGRINGMDQYHAVVLRGTVSGTTTQTVTPGDTMEFIEHGGAWNFRQVNSTGTNAIWATVNTSGISWNGNTVLHAGNYTSYSPSLSGSYADPSWITSLASSKLTGSIDNARLNGGTYTINVTGASGSTSRLATPDTRNVSTIPNDLSAGLVTSFQSNASVGLSDGGTFNGLWSFRQYASGGDWTGGVAHQLGFTDNANIWHRIGTSGSWGSWSKLLDSSNYSSYALPLSGGTLTGNTQLYANSGGDSPRLIFGPEAGSPYSYKAIYTDAYWLTFQGHVNEGMRFRLVNGSGITTYSTLTNSYLDHGASLRAPIFYDLDNTSYYVNPNSESWIHNLSVQAGNENPGGANSSSSGLVLRGNYNSNTWAHKFHKMDVGGGVPVFLSWTVGTAAWSALQSWGTGTGYPYTSQVFGSFRSDTEYSTVYYDSNDTGRYLDPNGTSILGGLFVAATASTGRSSYGSGTANLVLYAESTYGRATIDFRSGVNYPSDGAQIYYETATNLSSGETSRLVIRTENDADDSTLLRGGFIQYLSITVDGGSSNPGHRFTYGTTDRMYIYSDNTTEVGSFRAPIFYDSSNTAYYVDPNSNSRLSGYLATDSYIDVSGALYTRDYYYILNAAANGWNTVINRNGGNSWIVYGGDSVRAPMFYDADNTAYYSNPAGSSYVYNIDANFINTRAHIDIYGPLYSYKNDVGTILQSFNQSASNAAQFNIRHSYGDTVIENTRGWTYVYGSAVQTNNSYHAPIFYDSNDTGYYADFNSTGTSINAAGSIRGTYYVASNYGSTGYTQYKGYDNNNHFIVIRGYVGGNTSSPSITGGHGTTLVEYAEGNDSTGWFFRTAATGNYDLVSRITRSYSYFESSVRSPLFYDSDNTAYYCNPAGTSVFSAGGAYGAVSSLGWTAPIQIGETNIGSSGGAWVPMISQTSLSYSGYRQHTVFGSYRGSVWGSAFIAVGGNDNYPTVAFYFNYGGDFTAPGNVTAYSDERLKTNWRDMPENFVTRLAQVKVGIYDRVDNKKATQVGVSAQSLQKLLPQAVVVGEDEAKTLSVSYGNAALASAVELAKEVVDLRARVAHLESLINKLTGD